MTTLRTPQWGEFSEEERAILEQVAKRMGESAEGMLGRPIWSCQAHWPAWLAANHVESNQAYRRQGKLPQLAKEAMHVAVSMTNKCDY